MEVIKFILLIVVAWPTIFIYEPGIKRTTKEWEDNESIPPRYSKRTKVLLRKQRWFKIISILLGIIPLGPISMLFTWLSIRGKHGKGLTIKEGLAKQYDRVEDFKEDRRRKKELFIKNMKSQIEMDNKIDWAALTLNLNLAEDKQFRDFLDYLAETNKKKKWWQKNKKNKVDSQVSEEIGEIQEDTEDLSSIEEDIELGESIPKLSKQKIANQYGEDFVQELEESSSKLELVDDDYPDWGGKEESIDDSPETELDINIIEESKEQTSEKDQDNEAKFKKYSI